jgi:hypothetical protein
MLAFALSTQVAEAQVVNCMMRSAQANDDHAGMMERHRVHDAGNGATRSGHSHNQSSGATGCNQTMLCANVAAVPTTAMRSSGFDNAEAPISPGASVLRARTLRPDPPPPRI